MSHIIIIGQARSGHVSRVPLYICLITHQGVPFYSLLILSHQLTCSAKVEQYLALTQFIVSSLAQFQSLRNIISVLLFIFNSIS